MSATAGPFALSWVLLMLMANLEGCNDEEKQNDEKESHVQRMKEGGVGGEEARGGCGQASFVRPLDNRHANGHGKTSTLSYRATRCRLARALCRPAGSGLVQTASTLRPRDVMACAVVLPMAIIKNNKRDGGAGEEEEEEEEGGGRRASLSADAAPSPSPSPRTAATPDGEKKTKATAAVAVALVLLESLTPLPSPLLPPVADDPSSFSLTALWMSALSSAQVL